MKSLTILVISIFLIASPILTKAQVEVSPDVTFSVFYENLAPYGQWVDNPSYGQVWIPDEQGFVPYRTNGNWAYTEDGWTWVSDYDWGWAPFHYGRWNYDDNYGSYYWVPGYDWGPAWVSWRRNDDVYGWAPLSPEMNIGIGMSFGYEIPVNRWTFISPRYISHPHMSRYYVDSRRNVTIINNTTFINNVHQNNYHTTIVGGPGRSDVEHYTHSRINTYTINNSSRPNVKSVNNNTLNLYRPVVNKTTVINRTVISNNQRNTDFHNRAGNNKNLRTDDNQGANRRAPNNSINNNLPAGQPTQRTGVNPSRPAPVTQQSPQVGNQNQPQVNPQQQRQQRQQVDQQRRQQQQQRPQLNQQPQQQQQVNPQQQTPQQQRQQVDQQTQHQQQRQRPQVNQQPQQQQVNPQPQQQTQQHPQFDQQTQHQQQRQRPQVNQQSPQQQQVNPQPQQQQQQRPQVDQQQRQQQRSQVNPRQQPQDIQKPAQPQQQPQNKKAPEDQKQ